MVIEIMHDLTCSRCTFTKNLASYLIGLHIIRLIGFAASTTINFTARAAKRKTSVEKPNLVSKMTLEGAVLGETQTQRAIDGWIQQIDRTQNDPWYRAMDKHQIKF